MTDFPIRGRDLSDISPDDFAKLVKETPNKQLDEVMADDQARTRILDEVFTAMKDRYAGGSTTKAAIHWMILDKPGGGYDHYETVLSDGVCTLSTSPKLVPRLTIRISGTQFLKLASGNATPTTMFFTGKLKLAGDVGFAAGLAKLFDIPKPS